MGEKFSMSSIKARGLSKNARSTHARSRLACQVLAPHEECRMFARETSLRAQRGARLIGDLEGIIDARCGNRRRVRRPRITAAAKMIEHLSHLQVRTCERAMRRARLRGDHDAKVIHRVGTPRELIEL